MPLFIDYIGNGFHFKAVLAPRAAQQFDITGTFVAIAKVFSYEKPSRVEPIDQKMFDKVLSRHVRQVLVEPFEHDLLDLVHRQIPELVAKAADLCRYELGALSTQRKVGAWVRLECHDSGRQTALNSLRANSGQNGLVTAMDAIEIADSHRAGAVVIEAWQGTVNSKNGFHIREFTILHCSSSGIFILTGPYSSQCRIVVLISGRGSNMQTIVETINDRALPARICAVISNRASAEGLAWAREQGVETKVVEHRDYASREQFDEVLAQAIDAYQPHYVLLAGFMRVLTPGFVERFNGRVLNIHPSLLPAFPGMHTHQQALAVGVQWHGCTIHFVTPVLDHGPIVAQGAVPVYAGDTPEILAARVLQIEHRLYAQVVCWLAEGRVSLDALQRVQVHGVASRSIVMAPEDADLL